MRGPATHFWFTCGLAVVAVGCAQASRAQGAPQPQLDSLSVVAAAVDFYFAGMAGKPRYPMQIDRYEPRPGGGILLRLSPDNTLIKRQGGDLRFSDLHEVCVEPSGEVHAITYTHYLAVDSLGCR